MSLLSLEFSGGGLSPILSSGVLVVVFTVNLTVSPSLISDVNEVNVYWPGLIAPETDKPLNEYLMPLLFNITIASYKSIFSLNPISASFIFSSGLVSSLLVGTTNG